MNELDEINKILPLELFPNSKDWCEGSVKERVLWLLSMYESSSEELARLESDVEDLRADLRRDVRDAYDDGYAAGNEDASNDRSGE